MNNSGAKGKYDIIGIIKTYTKHWKWFVLSVIIAMIGAYLKIQYTVPEYSAMAKIQIVDQKSGGGAPELNVLQDLDVLSRNTSQVEDEVQILGSRLNFIEVVKLLGINVKVTSIGKFMDSEVYKNIPFDLNFLESDSVIYSSKLSFYINITSGTTFGYAENEKVSPKPQSFGKSVKTSIGNLIVTPNPDVKIKNYIGKQLKVTVTPVGKVAQSYKRRTLISPTQEFSKIVKLSLSDPVQKKAKDIINTLVYIYNKNGLDHDKLVADRTSNFIQKHIDTIYSDLTSDDQNIEEFMANRGITNIDQQASINFTTGTVNKKELDDVEYELNVTKSVKRSIESQTGFERLPVDAALSSTANTAANAYNQIISQREKLLKNSTEDHPTVQRLDEELGTLKRTVLSSLNSSENNLDIKVNGLRERISKLDASLYSAPKNQRKLKDIERKQGTKEELFLYLQKKSMEAQIAFTSASPKSMVVDAAYAPSTTPVSPKKPIMYLAFLIGGLLLPFSVIYGNELLNNKITNKTGLESLVKGIPILAEIPRLSKKQSKLISLDDRTVLSESLRILRTNIDYLVKSKKTSGKNNVIYITSSVSGEGKTFLASNLAMVYAMAKKRVLLIGADIRNPKLYTFIDKGGEIDKKKISAVRKEGRQGLTEYLFEKNIGVNDITNVVTSGNVNIDVIYSGSIPPNPAELLMGDKMKSLIHEASEKYDYVIVDTAPLMVVTDTLLISEHADHLLYVTRSGVTDTKVLEFPLKLKEEGKLKNLSFVVNAVKDSELGYGGKYGYGYGGATKKWWKFWKK